MVESGSQGMGCMVDDYLQGLVIAPADQQAAESAQRQWNAVAKPLGSLGLLEEAIVKVAALTGTAQVDLSRRCVVVFCSDNGVVAQGVSQCDREVTAVVASNIARGISSVSRMCEGLDIDCLAVDMGIACEPEGNNLISRRIAAGTGDITQGPAMTREQALAAVRAGVELAGELASEGYRIIGAGEMGIGNTTTAAAVICALTGAKPSEVVGRGAGLSNAGLTRKVRAVEAALVQNAPCSTDPLGVLAAVGGFDLCGMCGLFLGGAVHRVPVVVDGIISSVAALCARRMREECTMAMLASHLSSEPAARLVMDELGLTPPLQAGMHLGEGTGAACLMPLLDMALRLYRGTTFDDCGIEPYEELPR